MSYDVIEPPDERNQGQCLVQQVLLLLGKPFDADSGDHADLEDHQWSRIGQNRRPCRQLSLSVTSFDVILRCVRVCAGMGQAIPSLETRGERVCWVSRGREGW